MSNCFWSTADFNQFNHYFNLAVLRDFTNLLLIVFSYMACKKKTKKHAATFHTICLHVFTTLCMFYTMLNVKSNLRPIFDG